MSGSNNILQWNPTQANQETDAQYSADSQRSGGASNPSVFDATLANKLFYQLSTFAAAFGQMMAGKGFTISDANLSTLAATLANILTTADVRPGMIQVPYSPSVQFDCSQGNGFQVSLTGNISSLSIINTTPGQLITMIFYQANSGGYTVPFPGNVESPGTVYSAAGSFSIQDFVVDGSGNLRPLSPMTVS